MDSFRVNKNPLNFCVALTYPLLISLVRYQKLRSLNHFLSNMGVIGENISFCYVFYGLFFLGKYVLFL